MYTHIDLTQKSAVFLRVLHTNSLLQSETGKEKAEKKKSVSRRQNSSVKISAVVSTYVYTSV